MLKLLLCLFGLIVFANAQCNGGGFFIDTGRGYCNCYSGFGGGNCGNDFTTSCSIPAADPLATTMVGEISDYAIMSDHLVFNIYSDAFIQRYFSSLNFAGNTSCGYPESTFFTKGFNTSACMDIFSANIDIPALLDCGFTRPGVTNGFDLITGSVEAVMVDQVGSFRGVALTRTTTSYLGLELQIPATVQVNSTNPITVYSQISPTYAVTEQTYNPSGKTITVTITTSVQYPYALNSATAIGPAYNGDVTVADDPNNKCSPVANTPCFQTTTMVIDVAGFCKRNVDGVYTFNWGYACSSGVASCPATGSTGSEAVDITLTVDEFCGAVQVVTDIQGQLSSYADSGYTTSSLVYVLGQTVYFQVDFTTQVTLVSTVVSDLVLTVSTDGGAGVAVSLMSAGSMTLVGEAASFTDNGLVSATPSTATSHFNFQLISGSGTDSFIFDNTNPDSMYTFTVSVTFDVTYRTTFRKRDTVNEKLTFTQTLVLDNHANQANIKNIPGKFAGAIKTMLSALNLNN